jgi:hypothetical protein
MPWSAPDRVLTIHTQPSGQVHLRRLVLEGDVKLEAIGSLRQLIRLRPGLAMTPRAQNIAEMGSTTLKNAAHRLMRALTWIKAGLRPALSSWLSLFNSPSSLRPNQSWRASEGGSGRLLRPLPHQAGAQSACPVASACRSNSAAASPR